MRGERKASHDNAIMMKGKKLLFPPFFGCSEVNYRGIFYSLVILPFSPTLPYIFLFSSKLRVKFLQIAQLHIHNIIRLACMHARSHIISLYSRLQQISHAFQRFCCSSYRNIHIPLIYYYHRSYENFITFLFI